MDINKETPDQIYEILDAMHESGAETEYEDTDGLLWTALVKIECVICRHKKR